MTNDKFQDFLAGKLTEADTDPVYCVISGTVIESLWAYAVFGVPTGGFLSAVLSNDLREAIARADEHNIMTLRQIVTYIYMKLPGPCWGSEARVDAWLLHHAEERRKPNAYNETSLPIHQEASRDAD